MVLQVYPTAKKNINFAENYTRGVQAHSNDYVAGLKAYLTKYIPAVEPEFLKAVKETIGSDDPKQYAEANMYAKYDVARSLEKNGIIETFYKVGTNYMWLRFTTSYLKLAGLL